MNPSPVLLKECREGKRKAQYQLFKICFPVLMGVCTRYASDDSWARAGMNEAYLRILDNLKSYRSSVPFEAWIKRIAINVMIDQFRKDRKVRELIEYRDFSDPMESINSPFSSELPDEESILDPKDLEALIQKLPPMSQKVFNLYAIDGFKHQEIADLLGISVGTSKWHLSSARKKLQTWVKELLKKQAFINKSI